MYGVGKACPFVRKKDLALTLGISTYFEVFFQAMVLFFVSVKFSNRLINPHYAEKANQEPGS